jgi:hypothetical protein
LLGKVLGHYLTVLRQSQSRNLSLSQSRNLSLNQSRNLSLNQSRNLSLSQSHNLSQSRNLSLSLNQSRNFLVAFVLSTRFGVKVLQPKEEKYLLTMITLLIQPNMKLLRILVVTTHGRGKLIATVQKKVLQLFYPCPTKPIQFH